MRTAWVLVLVAAAACGKSKCEKYADMEIRCGGYPKAEEAITRQLAEGMCEGAKELPAELRKKFDAEAACAAKFLDGDTADCAGYKACTNGVAAEP